MSLSCHIAYSIIFAAMIDIECNNKELFILNKISSAAHELGMPCYLIGGFVRDKIIGRKTKDADIVCMGDGIALAHSVAQKFNPALQVSFFKNFGTAQIKFEDFEIEFVGARKESYSEDSRKPQVEPGNLMDDISRRDFTINTLAISLNKEDFGKLIDVFNGVNHIQHKIITTPLEPVHTFSDDPLRMMRAIRFASELNFTIAAETFAAIQKDAPRLKIVSQERITAELNKIILSKKPSVGLHLLSESGLLQIFFRK